MIVDGIRKMKILFTGGSSFTGSWFIKALVAAGHEVVAVFTGSGPEDYPPDTTRGQRVGQLLDCCRPRFGHCFGDESFLKLIREQGDLSLLCHHAADVTNYKSPDFDVHGAVARNTLNLPWVLEALGEVGCRRIVLTGSVFEGHEGRGHEGIHFSPYGLSKSITAEIFAYYCSRSGQRLGKFVIPNPFGPYEELRFTRHLVGSWFTGTVPTVGSPDYIRDNIHVSLLALAYGRFIETLPDEGGFSRINPSGYAESQGAFARRFAAEMDRRLDCDCRVELAKQSDFSEPLERVNIDQLDPEDYGWSQSTAWDELADYYLAQKRQFE